MIDRDQLTPYQIATLVTAAYAVHGVLHDHDEALAERYAIHMGICGPDPEPDAAIAARYLAWFDQRPGQIHQRLTMAIAHGNIHGWDVAKSEIQGIMFTLRL